MTPALEWRGWAVPLTGRQRTYLETIKALPDRAEVTLSANINGIATETYGTMTPYGTECALSPETSAQAAAIVTIPTPLMLESH